MYEKSFSLFLLILAGVLGCVHLDARVPENLAGTSVFAENPKIEVTRQVKTRVKKFIKDKEGKDIEREVTKNDFVTEQAELPLTSLNLACGAEFLGTSLVRVFYEHGNVVDLVDENKHVNEVPQLQQEIEEADPIADAFARIRQERAQQGELAVEEPQEAAQAQPLHSKKAWKHNFYHDAGQIKPLDYKDCNPVGVLVRLLFWQDPGTSSLQNFHVSKTCMVVDQTTHQINWEETLSQWADMIAAVCCLTVSENIQIPTSRIDTAWMNFFTSNLGQKESIKKFFKSCMQWGDQAGFGKTLPLKVLMAGIYEMIGNNQEKIRTFYAKLGAALEKHVKISDLKKKITGIDFVEKCTIPADVAPYKIPVTAEQYPSKYDDSWVVFLMLKKLESGFSPLAYKLTTIAGTDTNYPDCVETTLRNIVCAIAQQVEVPFKVDLFANEFRSYFTKYPTMVAQTWDDAYSEFAALINNSKKLLYAREKNGYRYEVHASFINVLAGLNYMFDLRIEAFNSHEISINLSLGDANEKFIKKVLPIVNEKLKEKLGIGGDEDVIEAYSFKDIQGSSIKFTVNLPAISLECSLDCGRHAEVSSVKNKQLASIVLPTDEEQNLFPYLQQLFLEEPSYSFHDTACHCTSPLPHVKIVQLLEAPTETILRNLLHCFQHYEKNDQLCGMLYAAIAGHYKRDKRVYFRYLQICVLKGLLVEQAIVAVPYKVESEDEYVQVGVLNLLRTLVKKGEAYDKAIEVAQRLMISESCSVRQEVCYLFMALVEEGQAYNSVISTAQSWVESQHCDGWELFKDLVKYGQAYDEAIVAAQKGIGNEDTWIKYASLNVFKALVEKGQAYDEAIVAAQEGIGNENIWIKYASLGVFKALVEKGQAYDEARLFAEKVVEFCDDHLSVEMAQLSVKMAQSILEKLSKLVEKRKRDHDDETAEEAGEDQAQRARRDEFKAADKEVEDGAMTEDKE